MRERDNLFSDTEIILGEAYSEFFAKTIDTETNEPYSSYHACEAVIKKYQIDPTKLLPELFKSSSFLPKDIFEIIGALDEDITWTDFAMEVSYVILGKELVRNFPDLAEEEKRRFTNLL